MSGAVHKVQISVGHPVELDARFDAPTLWSSTSFIANEVIRMESGLIALEETVGPMKTTVDKVILECERLANLATNKVKEASEKIVMLKTKVVELESDLAESGSPAGKSYSSNVTSRPPVDAMDELIHMLDTGIWVEERSNSFIIPEKTPHTTEGHADGSEGELLRRLEAEIKMLTAAVGMLKACS